MLPFYFKQGKDYKMQETIIIEDGVAKIKINIEVSGAGSSEPDCCRPTARCRL